MKQAEQQAEQRAEIETTALAWLAEVEQQRRSAGLRRLLRPRSAVATEVDLASNDYLGLSQHPAVIDGGVQALRTWGAGATGSRLVTGDTELHQQLETALADFVGMPAGLVFSSGYTANLGAVVGLSGPGSLVVSDAHSHASLVDACRLSRARVVVAPHRDVDAVDTVLASRDEERAVVVTDSVFSVDGALAPLRRLHEVCRRHRALLIVDEAHGLGVRGAGGRGLVYEAGLAGAPDVVMTTTLSKALGSQGGVVLGSNAVRDHLIDAARPFIFDTGLAPAAVGAAQAALGVLAAEPWRAEAVLRHAGTLADACNVYGGQSAVVSVILGDPQVALAAATACLDAGIRVGCFRPPTVPAGTSRLRLTARASLTADELDVARRALIRVLRDHRAAPS
ncbi:MAG TPA: 8-amino-7-oxononanoate synthase [Mycobacterium sp.]|nr:8-amino-7-oxononanoate synthase [Mycobacterium sp.]